MKLSYEYITLKNSIDADLKKYEINIDSNKLKFAIKYALNSGGKRLRSVILLKLMSSFGSTDNIDFHFVRAIEFIHTYSLIHDDLPSMDNDYFRRGQKAVHVVFGENYAILAGDALLNLAFEEISKSIFIEKNEYIKTKKIEAFKFFSEYSGILGMIGGQAIDIEDKLLDKKDIQNMYELKTCKLIQSACLCGSLIGGISKNNLNNIIEYGKCLGLAFQIRDDLFDISEDKKNNKKTYPLIFGIEMAKKDLKNFIKIGIESILRIEELVDKEFFINLIKSFLF